MTRSLPKIPSPTPIFALLSLIIAIAISAAFSWPRVDRPWRGLVKVGLVVPFTRYDAHTAYDVLLGARLALREWNAKGGVEGYRVELVAHDDENDAEVAARRARELMVDRDVLGVIGHLSSEPALGAAEEYRRGRAPLLTFASASALTAGGDKAVLRLGPNDEQLARSVLDSLSSGSRIENVAVVRDRAVGAGLEEAIEKEVVSRGGAVVYRVALDRASRDFEDVVERLKANRAGLVVYIGDYRQAAAFFADLRRRRLESEFVALGSDTPDFLKVGGNSLHGAMYVASWPILDREDDSGKKFVEKYVAMAQAEPARYGPITYDAVNLFLNATERNYRETGRLTREGVSSELARSDGFAGVAGVWMFDEKGDLKLPRPILYRIEEAGGYPGVAIK